VVTAAAAFIAGIVVGEKMGFSWWPLGVAIVIVAVSSGVNTRRGMAKAAAVLLLFFALGVIRVGFPVAKQSGLVRMAGEFVTLTGWVGGEPDVYPDRAVYIIKAAEVRAGGRQTVVGELVQLVVFNPGGEPFRYGDMLRVRGILSEPDGIRNPGDFDYRQYLARRGIHTRVLVYDPVNASYIGSHPCNPVLRLVYELKRRSLEVFASVPPRERAVIEAFLFGNQEGIDPALKGSFARVGVIHILSVSALHVGLVMAFVLGIASVAQLKRGQTFAAVAAVLLCYGIMTGFSPSVQRATLMGLVGLGGFLLHRHHSLYNSLALAALIILLGQPYALFEPGFQLSFVAACGLFYLGPPLSRYLKSIPWGQAVAATVGAELAIWPLTAYYFNMVSVISVLSNLVVVGLAAAVVNLGWMAVIVSTIFRPVGMALADADGALTNLLLGAVGLFDRWPYSAVVVTSPGVLLILGYYLVLVLAREGSARRLLASVRLRQAERLVVGGVLVVGILAVGGSLAWPKEMQAIFLDVGQGDCFLFRVPGYGDCLIDAGGSPSYGQGKRDFGESVVVPALRRLGVRHLKMAVVTHEHDDHMGGMAGVIRLMPIQTFVVANRGQRSGEMPAKSNLPQLMREARRRGTRTITLDQGDLLRVGGAEIEVLYPPGEGGPEVNENNRSLVLRLQYRHVSFLLTGDAEVEALKEIISGSQELASTVLKLPHHGSANGFYPGFYDRVSPKVVIISVGKNCFGHPAPRVVGYWRERRVPLFRTDRHGAVVVATDGTKVRVRSVRADGDD